MTNAFSCKVPGINARSGTGFGTLIAILALFLPAANAGITTGNNVVLSGSTGSTVNFAPAVAYDPSTSQYLVAWTVTDNDPNPNATGTTYNRVVGLLVGYQSDGSFRLKVDPKKLFTISNPQTYPDDLTLGGANPAVVFDGQRKRYFVAYRRTYDTSSNRGIFGQVVQTDGTIDNTDQEIRIQTAGSDLPTAPLLAFDDTNSRYLVAWRSGSEVAGSLLNSADLTASGSTLSLATNAENPNLTFNSKNPQYLLTYDAFSSATNSQDIFAKRISSAGQVVDTTALVVSNNSETQTNPQAVYNPDNDEYSVLWADSRDSTTRGVSTYGRIVGADGTVTGSEYSLAGFSTAPVLRWARTENVYLLGWTKEKADAAKNGFLFGRMLAPDLNSAAAGPTFGISGAPGAKAGARSLALDSAHRRALMVWTRSNGDGSLEIVGQLLDISTRLTSMSLAGKAKAVKLGDSLIYDISATNTGNATAANPTLDVTLPDSVTYSGTKPDNAHCVTPEPAKGDPTVVHCDWSPNSTFANSNIKPGATRTIHITATPTQVGAISAKAVLDWDNLGSKPINKTINTKVLYPGSVEIDKPSQGDILHGADSLATIQWNVRNDIGATAFNFRIQASLDDGKTWDLVTSLDTPPNKTLSWSVPWNVPVPRGNRAKAKIRIGGTATINVDGASRTVSIGKDVSDRFKIEVVKLTDPNSGAELSAGSSHTVTWTYYQTASPVAISRVQYSLDNGRHWKPVNDIAGGPAGDYSVNWNIPLVTKNVPNAKVRVILLNANGQSVGKDASDNGFPIKVLDLTGPTGSISSASTEIITWKTSITGPVVTNWKLQLSTDNGSRWSTIDQGEGNPETYSWQVPSLNRLVKQCKLRLILSDAEGKQVAVDTQAKPFTILP